MEEKIYIAESKNYRFLIEEDHPDVGWYLYVYEGGQCTADYLQETFQASIEQAEEQFHVPRESWVSVNTKPSWAL